MKAAGSRTETVFTKILMSLHLQHGRPFLSLHLRKDKVEKAKDDKIMENMELLAYEKRIKYQ